MAGGQGKASRKRQGRRDDVALRNFALAESAPIPLRCAGYLALLCFVHSRVARTLDRMSQQVPELELGGREWARLAATL